MEEIKTQKPKQTSGLKRFLRIFIILLIVIGAGYFYWKYFFTYSDGNRTGLLQKFSHKGTMFKTYEGELVLSSVKSTSDVAIASEKFLFSVPDERIATQLQSLEGHRVVLHYKEKNGVLPWRGDSQYLVDSVVHVE